MPRTLDSILQATMVMAVIVMSPYAMFATKGCGGERGQPAPDAAAPEPASVIASADDPEPEPEPGPAAARPGGYACEVPAVEIPRSEGCEAHEPYPACKWKIPDPEPGGPYAIWRYTTSQNRWGRPALVTLALAAAREYASLHPGEPVTLGDLDAPGDRHRTHASGVDVDLYLPGRMARENMGKSRWEDNYAGQSKSYVHKCRDRVLDLAKILAACANGRIRIYYNDPPVIEAFLDWFGKQGLVTPFAAAMEPHNELHLFHFHATIPEDLEVLAAAGPTDP
jgi:hypothetical protein